ncbi:MAG: crossover junction endodeoxyribonuclease RuvC [Treponema sp.]|nr:MAG: crossover junction endodeoxyribonuclease RuvC [Treponema sp.]
MASDLRVVLGIDPGLAATGFGVVGVSKNRFVHIDHGAIVTSADLSQQDRLVVIYDELSKIVKKYKPSDAGVESLYFAKNVTSALGVSEARGVSLLLLAKNGVATIEYSPNTIKKSVTGIAKADKKQVQHCVKILLGLPDLPKPNHAADALAAAITRVNIGDVQKRVMAYV